MNKPAVLIIYTGGTIGMIKDHETGTLKPFNFSEIEEQVPELKKFGYHLETHSFEELIDSSNIKPERWIEIARIIEQRYSEFDGFVVLHGTDTMAYTASALSFIIENNTKPIILTGSQLPIGTLRTDGKENLITAIEIAAAQKNGQPMVPEVCIYFENKLFRGNRTTKYSVDHFNAFVSDNYPPLAVVGINIEYNYGYIHYPGFTRKLHIHDKLDCNVTILKLFPGIQKSTIEAIINIKGLKGIVMESYGAGNAPTDPWFIELIKQATDKGIYILNITQCSAGSIQMGRYETSLALLNLGGVISGLDITTEAAVTKMMYVLSMNLNPYETGIELQRSLSGEINM